MTASPLNHSVGNPDRLMPILVIGIGSPHGDDRVGWDVIDRLAPLAPKWNVLRKATVPNDILDWLEDDQTTHIIDASCDDLPGLRRFDITRNDAGQLLASFSDTLGSKNASFTFSALRSNSTHQLDLFSILELVVVLGRLPRQLVLWTISVKSIAKNSDIDPATLERVQECVGRIAKELFDA